MNFKKVFFDTIDSTNTYLINNYQSYDNNTIIISKTQTNGRGQKNNVWESQIGGLYFSILLKPYKINTLISLIAGISVLETLKYFSDKDFKIKWPNDILLNDTKKKISGILVESKVINNEVKYLIVGIGININQDCLLDNAISLKNLENKEFDLNNILDYFLNKFQENIKYDDDFIIEKINNNLFGKNNFFEILMNDNIIKAKILCVNKEGHLIVNCDNKEIKILSGRILL
ncbi:MAG: biotin--[acetyl-CoA-carboxylase] ligase [Candidatus Sericytochromatia bacterium]|nr:MAG: biotin--[acetyl-CoA-carboxylase] ligase [Candidatus Sericytochromatia bacterium]